MNVYSRAEAEAAAFHDVRTLAELFAWRVRKSPDAAAYLCFDAAADDWVPVTWRAMARQVDAVASALTRLALPHGARIAILLPNGVQALSVDLAALALGCVPVPMHALDNPASIAYILADSDASVLVAQSAAQWQAIVSTGVALPALRQVIVAERAAPGGAPLLDGVAAFEDWVAGGGPAPAGGKVLADDLAALVYTSGTTGRPKGVMLSHRNVLENVKATLLRVAPQGDDLFLSFLPLSHTFERTAGYYLPMAAGSTVAFARSTALLAEDFRRVRPTVLISVPRIYERAYLTMRSTLDKAPLQEWLFDRAWSTGWRRFCRRQRLPVQDRTPAWLDELVWPFLDRAVAGRVRAQFGGRLRAAVSGGAALQPAIAHCFLGLGIPLLQGYGMTETSPVVAVNGLNDNDPATIGRPLSGVEVRIGENRELQVRGPGVMRGYWKREPETRAAFADGWLRTGDQADIVDGRIRILGRIKEILVTSTGEKIAPADLEQAILADPLFEQAWVFGEGRPFLACAVVLERTGWAALAASLNLDPGAPESVQAPAVSAAVLRRIAERTRSFPYYAQPRAVIVSLAPWTAENTLLTPTLKLKRLNLASHFADEIAALYQRREKRTS